MRRPPVADEDPACFAPASARAESFETGREEPRTQRLAEAQSWQSQAGEEDPRLGSWPAHRLWCLLDCAVDLPCAGGLEAPRLAHGPSRSGRTAPSTPPTVGV